MYRHKINQVYKQNWISEENMLNNKGDTQTRTFKWSLNFSARYIECTVRQYPLGKHSSKLSGIFSGLQRRHWAHLPDEGPHATQERSYWFRDCLTNVSAGSLQWHVVTCQHMDVKTHVCAKICRYVKSAN